MSIFRKSKTFNILLDDGAKMPTYAHREDACMDIYSNEDTVIEAGTYKVVKTGVRVDLKKGWEIQVRSKSGLAAKYGVSVLNSPGTIDAGYTGEIGVILMNNGNEDFKINRFDKIAQICPNKIYKMKFKLSNKLTKSQRGEGGFGSTGRK